MKEDLKKLEKLIEEKEKNLSEIKKSLFNFLNNHVKGLHIENYIGDYPTFMEPVILGENVKIGDDALIGPNVYIGNNCELGDYIELSNTIVLDNVKFGSNLTVENCIVGKNTKLEFNNLKEKNCIIIGGANNRETLKKISF